MFTVTYYIMHDSVYVHRTNTAIEAIRIARVAYEEGYQPTITEEYPGYDRAQ